MPEKPHIRRCPPDNSDVAIHLKGSYRWSSEGPAVLKNIDIQIKQGQVRFLFQISFPSGLIGVLKLVAIIGKVGSGKSSLLQAILGEMQPDSSNGCCNVDGSVAYVSQEPFILSRTILDNVTFELPLNKNKAMDALHIAQMQHDLTILADAENTLVGEKGVTISGAIKVVRRWTSKWC